jgi:hypothetical protein
MQYRGIRYTIRAGIERARYRVCIHPDDDEMSANKIFLSRKDAEAYARHMINRWLAGKSRQNAKRSDATY